jgi:anti-anti-sigma factor
MVVYPLETLMCADRPLGIGQQDSSTLLVDVDHRDAPWVRRITAAGEIDAVSAVKLRQTVVDLLARWRPERIEINLRGVIFLDSAGIRALLGCHRDAQRANCRLTLTDPHPNAYLVLEITGLLDYFEVTATRAVGDR